MTKPSRKPTKPSRKSTSPSRNPPPLEDLKEPWAGVDLKLSHAEFFLERMGRVLQPPERTQISVAMQASGAIIANDWQRAIYAYIDGFLAMARSVPEIIHACFGADKGNPVMEDWLLKLSPAEQARRQKFTAEFREARKGFAALPLSNARNISLHRIGFAPVQVNIAGRFGVVHLGSPIARVPDAESRPIVPNDPVPHLWASPPIAVQPVWSDFTIDGRPLFPECQAYLAECGKLVASARTIVTRVHGDNRLTRPPS